MTPKKQQIAIAEACPNSIRRYSYPDASGIWEWSSDGDFWNECDDNNPLSDLNAMHEAEKVLTDEQRHLYGQMLGEATDCLVWRTGYISGFGITKIAHATAVQRAEAFLRSIGKWEEAA